MSAGQTDFSKWSGVPFLKLLLTLFILIWVCLCCRNCMTRICKFKWLKPAFLSPHLGIKKKNKKGLISKIAEQPVALIGIYGNCWIFSAFGKSGHLCNQLIVAIKAQLQHLVLQRFGVALPRNLSKLGHLACPNCWPEWRPWPCLFLGKLLSAGWGLSVYDVYTSCSSWGWRRMATLCDLEVVDAPGCSDWTECCLCWSHHPGPHQLPLSNPGWQGAASRPLLILWHQRTLQKVCPI